MNTNDIEENSDKSNSEAETEDPSVLKWLVEKLKNFKKILVHKEELTMEQLHASLSTKQLLEFRKNLHIFSVSFSIIPIFSNIGVQIFMTNHWSKQGYFWVMGL
jgi:hypothetical protein